MADIQPAQLFTFDTPLRGGPPISQEMRDNYEALARTLYTENGAYPEVARQGMLRIFRDLGPPVNVKLQWWDGTDWRTIAQNIEGGTAVPTKLIVDINSPLGVWTIDHNLGSQVVAQVFDTAWNALTPQPLAADNRIVKVAHLPGPLLATFPPGPPVPLVPIGLGGTAPYSGAFIDVWANSPEGLTGAPVFTVGFDINATPLTGGTISIPGAAPPGAQIPGSPITAANVFAAGNVLNMLLGIGTNPAGGSLDVFALWQRTLNAGEYRLEQPTQDRIIVTHPIPTTGHVVLIG